MTSGITRRCCLRCGGSRCDSGIDPMKIRIEKQKVHQETDGGGDSGDCGIDSIMEAIRKIIGRNGHVSESGTSPYESGLVEREEELLSCVREVIRELSGGRILLRSTRYLAGMPHHPD